ncbi:MAG: addiction module protein [Pirellulaceae bacterium]|jgi:putative addiction module component (TIGR02574 family)|nr:addiction module protein [Pirellulaceae bacterium]
MSTTELPADILALSIPDRIELAIKIWDSVGDEAATDLSNEHRRILDERLEQHQSNPGEGESWASVKAELWKNR